MLIHNLIEYCQINYITDKKLQETVFAQILLLVHFIESIFEHRDFFLPKGICILFVLKYFYPPQAFTFVHNSFFVP